MTSRRSTLQKTPFTIDDLVRILRESAGVDEAAPLDGAALDASFEDLGYDSLALLETSSRIKREFGVELLDELLTIDRTPNALVDNVREAQASLTS